MMFVLGIGEVMLKDLDAVAERDGLTREEVINKAIRGFLERGLENQEPIENTKDS